MCEMQEKDQWKMRESKEGDPEVRKRFCSSSSRNFIKVSKSHLAKEESLTNLGTPIRGN